jgi:hypothetical protein
MSLRVFLALVGLWIEPQSPQSPGCADWLNDGAILSKTQWSKKTSPEIGTRVTVPGELREVQFMVKDSKRFADSNGWGYALFNYDAASGTFTPSGTGVKCGAACHNAAAKKDYVFTAYALR